ncbi:hypothetical protein SAMN02799631_00274 [Methylobacterium sp. 174MFSha1.1]|uniref:hypothetical protein n=1 Tax=Methylobacterium sp. 174MFSha1.1 TaxID=1502749 RepID=UPI0008EF2255|nr:hypothetical protein [Methylobacterium sp. 174MFSha1.1]SFU34757.1 hypothetical protein SAMN02799631_00274 [Methylobacterium sp. 174MFSha1.1]
MTNALDRAEPFSALAMYRGSLKAPTRSDAHPFIAWVRYIKRRWESPPLSGVPTAETHWDAELARDAAQAWAVCRSLPHLPIPLSPSKVEAARDDVERLGRRCAQRVEEIDRGPFLMDLDDHLATESQEGILLDYVRIAHLADACLAETGNRAALERSAAAAERCGALRAPGFLRFSVGARSLLAHPEGLGTWRPGGPPLCVIQRSLDLGREILGERAGSRDADADARDAQGGCPADDDRAEIVRRPPARPKPFPATLAPKAVSSTEPEDRPEPGPSLVVFPALTHLAQPSLVARDRGDSPRALCEPVAEVALPLTPAPEPAAVAATLNAAFPWAREVTEHYASDLVGAPFAMLRPRTLVGGAGGGKTAYSRALLKACGLPEVLYSAAGVMDGGNFAGASRTWTTWRLSVPAQGVLRFRLASLGCIIDEAEKAGPSRRWGRLDETLLPFLERGSTAKAIFDPALEVPLDLSGISYILTANTRDGVSGPLLDRAPPVEWPMPRREHMPVAAAAILDELRRERGLDEAWCPPLDGDELDALSAWRGGSLRPLRRMVEGVLAARDVFARAMPN